MVNVEMCVFVDLRWWNLAQTWRHWLILFSPAFSIRQKQEWVFFPLWFSWQWVLMSRQSCWNVSVHGHCAFTPCESRRANRWLTAPRGCCQLRYVADWDGRSCHACCGQRHHTSHSVVACHTHMYVELTCKVIGQLLLCILMPMKEI